MQKMFGRVLILFAFAATETAFSLELPVADPKFKQCLLQLATKHHWSRPEDFTEVVCHNKDIVSVEGINDFQNISKLSLYKNTISNLNLIGLKQLKHINVAKNALESITLNNLSTLSELYLFNNNLHKLTLENMPALSQVKVNSNQLTSVNFKHLGALAKLYLFDNKLEHLDIKTIPSLKYIDVRQNPMPNEFYDELDAQSGLTALHDGNSEDWQ